MLPDNVRPIDEKKSAQRHLLAGGCPWSVGVPLAVVLVPNKHTRDGTIEAVTETRMEDPSPARQVLDCADTQISPTKSAEDLLAEALACVAWDGTVDTDRLASIEFAHDEATVRRVVGLAAAVMDSHGDGGALARRNGITIGGVAVDDEWDTCSVIVMRSDGSSHAWKLTSAWTFSDVLAHHEGMTDKSMSLYCALVARGPLFSMMWTVPAHAIKPAGHRDNDNGDIKSPTDAGWCIEWRSMWMSRVIGALAAASGAWTGDEVMRTQSLARALMTILRERNTRGPLGECDPTQPTAPSDPAESSSLREAFAIAKRMSPDVKFDWTTDDALVGATHDAVHALATLQFVITATQRVYETQALYTHMILPAEYDALQRNTPAGAFK